MSTAGSLDTKHPRYMACIKDWELCRDTKRGERVIKEKGFQYLPATHAMIQDGLAVNAKGWCDYQNYLSRAVFHSYMERAIDRYMGLLWEKEPKIDLPEQMEPLREKCNRKGESLMQLLRMAQEECLTTSRLGLFADLPMGRQLYAEDGVTKLGTEPIKGELLPYINMYKAESIINWDEGESDQVVHDSLNLVVLDESSPVRTTTFEWENRRKWRVLMLGEPGVNEEAQVVNQGTPIYRVGVFTEDETFDMSAMVEPSWHGNKLNHIPFVFINSKDIVPEPDDPCLLNLARKDITIYRGEADYRQTLFMQGQYTFVITGEPEPDPNNPTPVRTGVGALLRLTNPAGRAEYVGIDAQGGLAEQRTALENDTREAEVLAGVLTDNRSNDKESGDALGKRMAGQSASLRSVALSCALGLQTILRSIALWMGLDPEAVVVTPNLEFSETKLTPKDIVDLQTVKTAGGPVSDETVHYNMKRSGLTPFDYEQEQEKIDTEEPRVDTAGGLVGAPLDPSTEMAQNAQEHGQAMSEEQLKLAQNADKREAAKKEK